MNIVDTRRLLDLGDPTIQGADNKPKMPVIPTWMKVGLGVAVALTALALVATLLAYYGVIPHVPDWTVKVLGFTTEALGISDAVALLGFLVYNKVIKHKQEEEEKNSEANLWEEIRGNDLLVPSAPTSSDKTHNSGVTEKEDKVDLMSQIPVLDTIALNAQERKSTEPVDTGVKDLSRGLKPRTEDDLLYTDKGWVLPETRGSQD